MDQWWACYLAQFWGLIDPPHVAARPNGHLKTMVRFAQTHVLLEAL